MGFIEMFSLLAYEYEIVYPVALPITCFSWMKSKNERLYMYINKFLNYKSLNTLFLELFHPILSLSLLSLRWWLVISLLWIIPIKALICFLFVLFLFLISMLNLLYLLSGSHKDWIFFIVPNLFRRYWLINVLSSIILIYLSPNFFTFLSLFNYITKTPILFVCIRW